jgi:hypothetical protein
MTKLSTKNHEEKPLMQQIASVVHSERKESSGKHDFTECPRGFGNIRKLNEDNSVSERCLGCYRIMECYSEND